jgi:hypothetical protein
MAAILSERWIGFNRNEGGKLRMAVAPERFAESVFGGFERRDVQLAGGRVHSKLEATDVTPVDMPSPRRLTIVTNLRLACRALPRHRGPSSLC